ncbi:Mariner Mos1 transposase-like Protein [Tribolium castaneum]|uniref:Mariner Mos1 transposase-like Protein n=1 Tax=Tribolium castaneum TaxID=7070 RepID=D7GYN6_TRICA|nr:Mariner Mos1 transposase-like Protein [Tribolium castaneum]
MEQTEIRAVIKYFFIKGLSSKDIKSELDNTLGDSSPSYTTIKTWVADFKRGRKSTEDAPRSGRPKTATCKEIVEKVHKIVLNDRRSKLVEIAEAVGISTERVHYILTEVLDMRKLSARWVPRLLTPEQKLIRKMISEECLARLQHNPVDFLRRFITVDETWIHHYSPETKQQSKQWTAKGEPVPKKAKTLRSAGKVSIGMLRKNALARPETFQFILVSTRRWQRLLQILKLGTHLKFENHLTSWAVLFLLNLISGKYIFSTAELGYRTQKNINFAFLRCIGVSVDECSGVKEIFVYRREREKVHVVR